MHINSTVLSGQGVLNDLNFLFTQRNHVVFLTDKNIINLPIVSKLIKTLEDTVSNNIVMSYL
jgi:hypothetical protein